MILTLDPKASTLLLSNLTTQDFSALSVLAVGDTHVGQ